MELDFLDWVILIALIALLTAYFGFGLMATSPWWVIWSPVLLFTGYFIATCLLFLIAVGIISLFQS